MAEYWIALQDIPAQGREFSFEEQDAWDAAFAEHALGVAPVRPMKAEVYLLPQGKGAVIRGHLTGSVRIPCDRCSEPFEFDIDERFDTFEDLPENADESEGEVRVRDERGFLELDIWGVLWEQFVLALPVKPLCDEACKGLCPGCGRNLNEEECACAREEGDPRLAVFKGLKIK